MGVSALNLFDVVQRLRPRWLEVRSERSLGPNARPTEILVFQGQALLGGTAILQQFAPDVAYEMQWLDAATAAASLPVGDRRVAGAIVIRTR